ncbi:hypothetical protein NGQ54_09820, partial [Riemerella anatipestifer]|nr:hypothetical protein [Riemerella anatipestifer]MCU7600674.1 hypothetical protein [Riemerella anatipestifer]
DEQIALYNAITGNSSSSSSAMWKEQKLRLPASGYRGSYSGTLNSQSSIGWLWSSGQRSSSDSWSLRFDSGNSHTGDYSLRADGFSVRCLKD